MKTIKRALRLFIVALLAVVFAFSVAACKTGKPNSEPVDPDKKPVEPLPGETVQYTVTFANVDSTAYPAIKVDKNGTVSVDAPSNTDTKIFLGWYMDEECASLPFTMGSTKITQDTTLYAKWKDKTSGEVTKKYTVTFNSDGGSAVPSQSVDEGNCAFTVTPERAGYQFLGWYIGESKYDFKNVITKDITLIARWTPLDVKVKAYGGYSESLYVEWTDGAPSQATVQYKASGENDWHSVDSQLIRNVGNSVARVDALGLTAGDYDVKIQPSSGSPIEISDISVAAYDRSGYAHFNYTDGVGAYNDDGTLKDGALVIYVTEENKNSVKSGYVNGEEVDLTPYLEPGKTGIGYILNNNQYGKADRLKYGIQKISFTYGAVAVRFLGAVSAEFPGNGYKSSIEGLTQANTTEGGGSAKDNGRMARMTNAKNVTLEGVGEDAEIVGWGFHFVSNDNLHEYKGSGKSFEARNMTFRRYPEDALGMEGTQGKKVDATGSITSGASDADADLISPVERCWIHNNVFYPGYFENPKEADKAEGDGSTDIKRGQYFTVSYNYYEGCHKTNLVGSSDASQTFNYSMHHNWWFDCESRIPLLRRANMHFYNNYVQGEANSVVKDKGYAISYVTSARANSYMFSENNYFDGCNTVVEIDGGAVKAFGNVYTTIWGKNGDGNGATEVKDRTQSISNNCQFTYRNIDYRTFDTDPELFYYNATTKQSDCLLDDAITARIRVIQFAGVNGFGKNKNTNMNEHTPTSAVPVPDEGELNITLGGSSSNGVLFHTTADKNGNLKGKGQLLTFMLATEAEVTVSGSGSGNNAPELIDSYGRPYATKFNGEVTVVLPAGTYYITSGDKDKEANISALSFKSTAGSAQAKLDNLNEAINAIGTVTLSSGAAITQAQTLLNALNGDEITAFDTAYPGQRDKLTTAQTTYNGLLVQNVETLISAIGTVTDDSYPAIQAARAAYNNLSTALKSQVTNYSTLTAAEDAWANRAVSAISNRISALADPSTVSAEADIKALLADYNSVKSAYDNLTSDQQSGVTNYNKVTSGITQLEAALAPYNVRDMIAALPAKADVQLSDASTVTAARAAYDNLTAAQKTLVGDITKLTDAEDAITTIASQTQVCSFNGKPSNDNFTVSGKYYSDSMTINGNTYASGLKMESSTSVTFKTTAKMTLTLYLHSSCNGKVIEIDGVAYTATTVNGNVVIVAEIEAGNHTIAKGNKGTTNTYLYVAELSPAA